MGLTGAGWPILGQASAGDVPRRAHRDCHAGGTMTTPEELHDEAMALADRAEHALREAARLFREAETKEREAIRALPSTAHLSRAIMTRSAEALKERANTLEAQ